MPNLHDTPDGQTHHESDGCGEPAHNPLPKTNEEKLREEYYNLANKRSWGACFECCDFEKITKDTADHWLKVLAEQRKEWVESVRSEIETFILATPCHNPENTKCGGCRASQVMNDTTKAILRLSSLTTDSEECGALIHTRGFDGKGALYCAEKKPCKVHSK